MHHDLIVFDIGFVTGAGLIIIKLLFGSQLRGHHGTSQCAPAIPMTKGPCSAVQPPTPQSTQVTLHEGSKPK